MESIKTLAKPPYKGLNGVWLTEALFFDRMNVKPVDQWTFKPLFTFFDRRDGYRCACDDFIALRDPTGYMWAMEYLGDYNHWERLMRTPWFPEVFKEWNRRLGIVLQAEALQKIQEVARTDGPQAIAAAKYIAEQGWLPKATKGRPSKAQVEEAVKHEAKAVKELNDDAARIGLKVINGN